MAKKVLNEEEKLKVKQLKKQSVAFLVLYYFFVAVVPIFIISVYFDLFKTASKYKASGILLIALIMIAVFFKNQLKRFYKSIAPSGFKTFIASCSVPLLLAVLLVVVWWASNSIYQLKMVLFFSMLSNMIAVPFNVMFSIKELEIKEIKEEDDDEEKEN